MSPQRIQRKRTKGWRMPEGAVYVGRPSMFGNPFHLGHMSYVYRGDGGWQCVGIETAYDAVALFCDWVSDPEGLQVFGRQRHHIGVMIPTLKGRDLACWCPLDHPCHADVLLELANGATS